MVTMVRAILHRDTDFEPVCTPRGAGPTKTEPALFDKVSWLFMRIGIDKCYKPCNFKLQLESDKFFEAGNVTSWH